MSGAARPSVFVLIAANLVPLVGVFLWDWSVFEIVLLYWAENVCIGLINVLKMITANPDVSKMEGRLTGFVEKLAAKAGSEEDREAIDAMDFYAEKIEDHAETIGAIHHAAKFFMIPFFCVHYGIFCLVHGVFVVTLLSGGGFSGNPIEGIADEIFNGPLFLSALLLGASHLFSFFVNFLGKGEYRKTALPLLMMQPYGRITVLHVAILGGGFATILLGSPEFLLLILIGGKIWLDVKMHLLERSKMAALPLRG